MSQPYKIAIITAAYNLIFILSGAVNWPFQLCVVSIGSALMVMYLSNALRTVYIVLLMLPAYLLYSVDSLLDHQVHVYPVIVFPVLAVLSVVLILQLNPYYRWIANAALLFVFTIPTYLFMEFWLSAVFLKQSAHDSEGMQLDAVIIKDTLGNRVDLERYGDTLVVLDFWNSSCRGCFLQFPLFQQLEDSYAPNKLVKFYTVHLRMKNERTVDLQQTISPYFKHNLFVEDTAAYEKLAIPSVPMYVLVKNGAIVFKGYTNLARSFFKHDLSDEIDQQFMR